STKAWAGMTLSFAVSQGVVGLLMAYCLNHMASYDVLFTISTAALMLSAVCTLMTVTHSKPEHLT
ncbi:MFS transporter, partial [Vibrio sp. 10N.222.52.B7]